MHHHACHYNSFLTSTLKYYYSHLADVEIETWFPLFDQGSRAFISLALCSAMQPGLSNKSEGSNACTVISNV
jgi:hypothetical protein